MANGWRIDDLDGDVQLVADLSNLHGLGAEFLEGQQVYDMSEVLSLPLFKSDENFVEAVTEISSPFAAEHFPSLHQPQIKGQELARDVTPPRFALILKAPTSPGKKLSEETLTYLNQSQSYEIVLQCLSGLSPDEQFLKGTVRLGFHDRKYQVIENEKFEEWTANRPSERLLEIDVPMCFGIHDVTSNGPYSNVIEFGWDAKADTRLFVRVNCVSSEFTKGKSGGESGIPLRLQIDTGRTSQNPDECPLISAGCQIKVFKPKGADRKLKSEKQKHENLPKEELDALQPSVEVTVLKETLVSDSTVEETQNWLKINRFHSFLATFANFKGSDLLALTRNDLIQLCGPADGIRLHNALQARASRPLLTMYVSPEWRQSDTGMKEYHAIFLEHLTVEELKMKLALKCDLEACDTFAIFKQGPTGILIFVDDEMVRNFMDEAHYTVQVLNDAGNAHARLILK
eukprot:Seg248.1 transcript_id=Seg248.1/GoldUCD/mRNA.D3Y31 product="alpha-globin transcription factor CP2" protein_id=Seg248.1/GoldUCD/D3Y31